MGVKNAVNVAVDVDPETGEFDPRPLVERIKADQMKVGKSKVSAPPAPRTWAYEPPKTEEEREERMLAFEAAMDMTQFTADERRAWNVLLSSDDKDLLWSVWQLFSSGDTVLPLFRADTRCAREMIKMLGGQRFPFLAKSGQEWLGVDQKDTSRDEDIQQWVETWTRDELEEDPAKGYNCTLMTRFVCSRRAAYNEEA